MKRFRHHKKGFTLIEILLVIALIGVIATLTITAYQKRAETVKVDKGALQIQQLLQAGMAYYVNNGCWPGSDKCQQPPPDFNPYIPVAGKENPWGYKYNWSPVNDDKLFSVESLVPEKTIADRVAAKLPNAEATPSRGLYQVRAEVGVPGAALILPKVIIEDMGRLSFTYNKEGKQSSCVRTSLDNATSCNISRPTCPKGYEPKVFYSINKFHVENTYWLWLGAKLPEPIRDARLDNNTWGNVGNSVAFTRRDSGNQKSGNISFNYTIICYRPPQALMSGASVY